MAKKITKTNKYNPQLMPENVKRKRTSVKFTEAEMEEILEVWPFAQRHGAKDKMDMYRAGILRYVRELKQRMKEAENAVIRRTTDPTPGTQPPLTLRQQADILGYKGRYTPEQIAELVDVPLEKVKELLGEG